MTSLGLAVALVGDDAGDLDAFVDTVAPSIS